MQNYFVTNDKKIIPIVGAASYSTGDGLETTQRYGHDYSDAPQGLVFRKRNTALTASMTMVFNFQMVVEAGYSGIADYLDDLQYCVGKKMAVFWHGAKQGEFVIISVQIASTVDAAQIFTDVSVYFAMTEGRIVYKQLSTDVRTM